MPKRQPRTPRIDLDSARNRLVLVWLIGAGILMLVIVIQGITGRFNGFASQFFGWFIPTIFPTIALMLGAIATSASEDDSGRTVKRFFLDASVGLSIFYLLELIITVLGEAFAGGNMDYFNQSNFWLSPVQGLVVAAVGALFNSRKKADVHERSTSRRRGRRSDTR